MPDKLVYCYDVAPEGCCSSCHNYEADGSGDLFEVYADDATWATIIGYGCCIGTDKVREFLGAGIMMLYACENDACAEAYSIVDLERRATGAECETCGWQMTACPQEAYPLTKLEPTRVRPSEGTHPCPGCGETAEILWRFEAEGVDTDGSNALFGHLRLSCPNRHFFTVLTETVRDPFDEQRLSED